MKKKTLSLSLAALSLCLTSIVSAQTSAPSSQESYSKAQAYCETLSGDAKINCQRDAYGAHHDKSNHHTRIDAQTLEQNRINRCNRLPESQRQECLAQMQGQHTTQTYGSVEGGGILRNTTIEIPGEVLESNSSVVTPLDMPARTITPIE